MATNYKKLISPILEGLKNGVAPWRKPWKDSGVGPIPLRANLTAYKGINVLLLQSSLLANGFTNNIWITSKQAKMLGTSVKKNEYSKSTSIVFCEKYNLKETETVKITERNQYAFLYRQFNVYNLDQLEKIPKKYKIIPDVANFDIKICEEFFENLPSIVTTSPLDLAFYSPTLDIIKMPKKELFDSIELYYSTLAHENIHWTGHKSRLDREYSKEENPRENYAREELIAEIGSSFVCSFLGIDSITMKDHVNYIGDWIRILNKSPKELFRAAAKAQKAAEYLNQFQKG